MATTTVHKTPHQAMTHQLEDRYVRLAVTGQPIMLFGPFKSRRSRQQFLNGVNDRLCDFLAHLDDLQAQHAVGPAQPRVALDLR